MCYVPVASRGINSLGRRVTAALTPFSPSINKQTSIPSEDSSPIFCSSLHCTVHPAVNEILTIVKYSYCLSYDRYLELIHQPGSCFPVLHQDLW